MAEISIAEAKAKFSELVKAAQDGHATTITRRGKPVARIEPLAPITADPPKERAPFDWAELRKAVLSQPMSPISGAELVRRMRDEERY